MLAQSNPPAVHVGEKRLSAQDPVLEQRWSITPPQHGAKSLADLAQIRQWLRPGDVVYVVETHRHVLTEDDLNAAARAVIGGVA